MSPNDKLIEERIEMKQMIQVAAVCSLFLVSCASLHQSVPRNETYIRYDSDTTYQVQNISKNSFLLSIQHEKKQYMPDMAGLAVSCKSALTSLAYTLADKQSRKIKPINEQRIQLKTDRYVEKMVGISLCNASVPVEWE
jgi:hypothetical protein